MALWIAIGFVAALAGLGIGGLALTIPQNDYEPAQLLKAGLLVVAAALVGGGVWMAGYGLGMFPGLPCLVRITSCS